MAKQDDTGAGAPDQPQYPMIEPGDPEATSIRTEAVLDARDKRPTIEEWIAVYKSLTEEQRQKLDCLVRKFKRANLLRTRRVGA